MSPTRSPNGFETRAALEGLRAAGRRLEGYAAVFNSPARIGGAFTESITPGAFRASLAVPGRDVLALCDHNPEKLLARTRSGTLRVGEDSRGLAFSLDVPDTTLGRDVLTMVERGDISACSFGFRVPPGGDAWPARDRRELRAVELLELSLVVSPAYDSTTVAARARQLGAVGWRGRLAGVLL